MPITNENLIELAFEMISGRTTQAFEQIGNNLTSQSSSFLEDLGPYIQKLFQQIGNKQSQAFQDVMISIQRQQALSAPDVAFGNIGNTVTQVLHQSIKELEEKWEIGMFKAQQEKGAIIIFVNQDGSTDQRPDPLVSQSTQPMTKLKILNPAKAQQQFSINQVFSYEDLTKDLINSIIEKPPITEDKPKAPRRSGKEKQSSELVDQPENVQQKEKKNKILNPQMLFQQYAIDKIFSFENLARDILEETASKKPHKGSEIKKIEPRKAPVKKQNVEGEQKKQLKTRTNVVRPIREQKPVGKSMQINNKFNEYKKQLASLEDKQEPAKEVHDGRRRVESESKRILEFSSPASQGKARVYRIGDDSIRKHSLKKSKQAENQMMANIEFLRSMRGSSNGSTPKKQWKQETSQVKKTIQEIRQSKRKHLQSLGFSDPASRLLQSKLGQSEVYSPQRSDILPQIRKSRKRGQVYKPAAFSVYTIQKDNEIFYNKFVK